MEPKVDAIMTDHVERIESLPTRRVSVDRPVHSKAPVWEEKGRSYGPAGNYTSDPIRDYCTLPTCYKVFEEFSPRATFLQRRPLQLWEALSSDTSKFAAVVLLLVIGTDVLRSQGVVSITLVMPQFLEQFPEIDSQNSGASFKKGLLTAMIELGAFLGEYRRRWNIITAVLTQFQVR